MQVFLKRDLKDKYTGEIHPQGKVLTVEKARGQELIKNDYGIEVKGATDTKEVEAFRLEIETLKKENDGLRKANEELIGELEKLKAQQGETAEEKPGTEG